MLGSYLGPPLAFWLGELAFRLGGLPGVYVLSQACIVTVFWAVFTLGRSVVGTRHAVLGSLLMAGVAAFTVPSPDFGPAILAAPLVGAGAAAITGAPPGMHGAAPGFCWASISVCCC